MAEDRKNFRDPITGEEFFIPEFSSVYRVSGKIYKDKWKKQIVNPKTGTVLEPIEREFTGVPMISKFNSKTAEGQNNIKNHFSSRSRKHDTVGAGKDEVDSKKEAFTTQLKDRMKDGKL